MLARILTAQEALNPISHLTKFELVKGDATQTVPDYFERHPESIVSLAIFDFDIYTPTRAALEAVKPRLFKGSVLVFDELCDDIFPGETLALMRKNKLQQYREFILDRGHRLAEKPGEADLTLVWTCGFRADLRDASLQALEHILATTTGRVLITGCLADICPELLPRDPRCQVMPIIEETKQAGVLLVRTSAFEDHRGYYLETYNEQAYREAGIDIHFVQDDISISTRHVLRGIHGDGETYKLISCLLGSFYFVVVDCRKDSPGFGTWQSFVLSETNHLQVLVPPGFGNAHLVMLIFRRELYTKLQGLDETLPYWGWSDIEIGLRVCQYHTTVDLLPFGIFAYDMSQRPLLRQDGIKRYNQHDAVNTRFTVNSENWGLSEHDLPALTMAEQCIQDKKSSLSPHERCRRMLTAVCAKLKSPEPSTVGKNAQNNPDEAALVLLVESAMAANGPRRLLDVGTRRLWPALAAAAVNPTIEIVTCDDWTPRSDMPQGAPHQFSQAFQQVGFVGLLHFLTGDVADMPERLAGIPAADRGFDFMILRLSMLGNRATETSLAFAKHLRPGGIVAITGSQESRQAIASALREMHGLDHLLTLDDVEVLFRK